MWYASFARRPGHHRQDSRETVTSVFLPSLVCLGKSSEQLPRSVRHRLLGNINGAQHSEKKRCVSQVLFSTLEVCRHFVRFFAIVNERVRKALNLPRAQRHHFQSPANVQVTSRSRASVGEDHSCRSMVVLVSKGLPICTGLLCGQLVYTVAQQK